MGAMAEGTDFPYERPMSVDYCIPPIAMQGVCAGRLNGGLHDHEHVTPFREMEARNGKEADMDFRLYRSDGASTNPRWLHRYIGECTPASAYVIIKDCSSHDQAIVPWAIDVAA